ncbi:MAG: ferrochelatase [Methylotenera sp.]|nr:ferrochelatase [Oligoflexia bacterium]
MTQTARTGILLMNLGTPDAPTPEKVGVYLKEFLMDPYVIDIPKPLRWFLVHALIVPKRSHASAAAYQKVWTERGSPLKFHSEDLTAKVQEKLGADFDVKLAMRYQNPSVRSVLEEWKKTGIQEIRVMPLYPQYAWASTRSSEENVAFIAQDLGLNAKIKYLKPFFREPVYIDAFSHQIERTLAEAPWDHLLFSYHGLPERQIRRSDASGTHCLKSGECCNALHPKNSEYCYRAHCYETSRQIARKLGLPGGKWSVSFQSRLGATKWITPYTDFVLNDLASQGTKKLVISCPAFTADCLETLEEIEIRANEQFLGKGGETLKLVPSLNSQEIWVKAVSHLAASNHFN